MLGFGAHAESNELRITSDDKDEREVNKKRDKLLLSAEQTDLIGFGLVPEFVGRFPVIVPFHSLDYGMLVRVLTEPRNSLLAQVKRQFEMENVCLYRSFLPLLLFRLNLSVNRNKSAQFLLSFKGFMFHLFRFICISLTRLCKKLRNKPYRGRLERELCGPFW